MGPYLVALSEDQCLAFRVAVWLGLDDKKCHEKLRGLDDDNLVSSGIVFRRKPVPGLSARFRQVVPPSCVRWSASLSHLYALAITLLSIRRFRPDVCVGISLNPHALLAYVASKLCGSSFLVWYIGTDMYRHLNIPLVRPLLLKILKRASCSLVMGERSRQELVRSGWPSEKVLVGYNAYCLDAYVPSTSHDYVWDLMFTGRLDRWHKGLDTLLLAVKQSLRELPTLRLAVVGDGPDRAWMAKRITQMRLEDHVHLLGASKDIPSLLQTSKAFIMTSSWEGLPASLVEAFCCGLPAIVPAVGDIEGIAKDRRNSIVVRTPSPDDFAEAVVRLLTDEELRQRLSQGAVISGNALRENARARASASWRESLRRCIS